MLDIPNISGGEGGISAGSSASAEAKNNFARSGGNISFGDRGIKQEYIIAGATVAVLLVIVLYMKG